MRSRYTAHVLHRWQHLWATWHPRTRPDVVDDLPMAWTGLTIVDVEQGPVSYTHLTLPTTQQLCRSRWSPYH